METVKCAGPSCVSQNFYLAIELLTINQKQIPKYPQAFEETLGRKMRGRSHKYKNKRNLHMHTI